MVQKDGVISRRSTFYLLAIGQMFFLTSRTAWADRGCPLPQPTAVGDVRLDVHPVVMNQLPSEVRNIILGAVPTEYRISLIVKSDFSEDGGFSDYLVFYDDHVRRRLLIARQNPVNVVQAFPVLRAETFKYFTEGVPNDWLELLSADIRPDSINIFRSLNGTVYAKTTGYERTRCWETVIFWGSYWFWAENILFGTSDGFNYPVGPMDAQNSPNAVDIQTANFPEGWKIDQVFQDCKNYPSNETPCSHLGEDWNGKGGGDTDLGYPVFAVSRGEVIFRGDAGSGWNGIVVLRHRPPDGTSIFSFYAHLNVDPGQKREDGSIVRTVGEILRQSSPGQLVEVEKGQLIGYIGPRPTRNTTAHLHFEIIVDPAIAYDKSKWKGYLPLYGSRTQWEAPSLFITSHQSYENSFIVGQDCSAYGADPAIFQASYDRNNGIELLGKAIGAVQGTQARSDTLAAVTGQAFQNGEIYYHLRGSLTGSAFAILNPMISKLRLFCPARTESEFPKNGFPATFVTWELGYPLSDISQSDVSWYGTRFKFQNFESGALEFHQNGPYVGEVFEIHGAIFNRWSGPELQYASGPLGLPITDEKEAAKSKLSGRTGRFSSFEGGVIHWVREIDKTFVIGLNQNVGGQSNIGKLIADRYKAEGGSSGDLGFPASDDYLWQNGVRCDLEGGYILWSPNNGIEVFKN